MPKQTPSRANNLPQQNQLTKNTDLSFKPNYINKWKNEISTTRGEEKLKKNNNRENLTSFDG
jgi:hypothetical protein